MHTNLSAVIGPLLLGAGFFLWLVVVTAEAALRCRDESCHRHETSTLERMRQLELIVTGRDGPPPRVIDPLTGRRRHPRHGRGRGHRSRGIDLVA